MEHTPHPEVAMWVPLKSRWHRLPAAQAAGRDAFEREDPAGEDVARRVEAPAALREPHLDGERPDDEAATGK